MKYKIYIEKQDDRDSVIVVLAKSGLQSVKVEKNQKPRTNGYTLLSIGRRWRND